MDTFVWQSERQELADTVVGQIPADRASAFSQEFHDTQISQRVGLQATQLARNHQAIEAGGVKLLYQCFWQALLAFDFVMIVADH